MAHDAVRRQFEMSMHGQIRPCTLFDTGAPVQRLSPNAATE
jgi:hypothetical protein